MRLVPRNKAPQIQFFARHLEQWAAEAGSIGLAPEDVADLAAKTDAARAALAVQQQAQAAAQSATLSLRIAMEAMASKGAAMILQIRAKANEAGNGVYPLASISPPNAPSPIGAPGTPHSFTFSLDQGGVLRLKWKCQNPRGSVGTMNQVRRQVGGSGAGQALSALSDLGQDLSPSGIAAGVPSPAPAID